MSTVYKILILGASYGSLLGAKLTLAGHTVKLVCLPEEADLINAEGARVRLPVRGASDLMELDTRDMSGELSADVPGAVNPADYDLVAHSPIHYARSRTSFLARWNVHIPGLLVEYLMTGGLVFLVIILTLSGIGADVHTIIDQPLFLALMVPVIYVFGVVVDAATSLLLKWPKSRIRKRERLEQENLGLALTEESLDFDIHPFL